METEIAIRKTEEDAILRECVLMGAIRRKEAENAKLRERIDAYEESRKRHIAATCAKYDRWIAEERAAEQERDAKISSIMYTIAIFLAGAGCMALMLQIIVMCLGG